MRSLRGVLRVALATLVLAGGLIFAAPAEPAGAMPAPDWHCDNSTPQLVLITCADEGAFVGVSAAVFASSYLPLLTAMGTAAFVDFVTGGMDYDQCISELPAPLEHRCGGLPGDTGGKGWLNKDPHPEIPGEILEGFCYLWPFAAGCGPEEVELEGWEELDPWLASGSETFVGAPSSYAGSSFVTGDNGLVVAVFDPMSVPEEGYLSVVSAWTCPSPAGCTGDHQYSNGGFELLLSRAGSTLTATATGKKFSDWGGQDTESMSFVPGTDERMAVIVRYTVVPSLSARLNIGKPSLSSAGGNFGTSGWYIAANAATVGMQRSTGAAIAPFPVGAPPVSGFVDGVMWHYRDLTAVPSNAEMQTIVTGVPSEYEIPAPPTPPESPFPVPEAPPAVPVPWPNAPGAPEAPEIDPVPEPDQYEEVTEGTGDEGLFDRLANRIGSAINTVTNAIGSVANWVVGQLGALLEWLLDQIRQLFQWLGDLLEGLLLWIGELLEWLGDLLGLVIDALEQLVSQLGVWFQQLIRTVRDVIGALGDLLSQLLHQIRDIIGDVWQAIVEGFESVVDAINEALSGIAQAVIDGIQTAIEWLFIPDSLDLDGIGDECEQSFPCSWIEEFADALELLGAGVGGAAEGACTTPSIGWSEFRASLPPPSGCSVNGDAAPMGGAASTAGDLWGYRTAFRSLAFVVAAWVFITAVIQMTPWAESRYYRLNPTQLELF